MTELKAEGSETVKSYVLFPLKELNCLIELELFSFKITCRISFTAVWSVYSCKSKDYMHLFMQDSNSEFVWGYTIGFHLWRVYACITLFPPVNGFWVHHSIPQNHHERSLLLNTLTLEDLRILSHLILLWKKDELQTLFMLTHMKPTCWFLFIQTVFARNR